jgi:hypothetical protein
MSMDTGGDVHIDLTSAPEDVKDHLIALLSDLPTDESV